MSDTHVHGFSAVARDHSSLLSPDMAKSKPPRPLKGGDFEPPDTPISAAVLQYARKELPIEVLHHSMRVYAFGLAFIPYLSDSFEFSLETYFLSCLLHDIGATPEHMHETWMSFEFHGGMIAHSVLRSRSSPKAQADAVAEAVIRHQDLGSEGKITALGALLQLATVFDNMGLNADFVHEDTIKAVASKWPRLGWSRCFGSTIRAELKAKPWAHTTVLGEEAFPQGVEGNEVMEPYD